MSDSEEHGHQQDSDPVRGLRTRTNVRGSREQVAPIADFLTEDGEGPGDDEPINLKTAVRLLGESGNSGYWGA